MQIIYDKDNLDYVDLATIFTALFSELQYEYENKFLMSSMFWNILPSLPFNKKVEHITQTYFTIPSEVISFKDFSKLGELMFRLRSTTSQTGVIDYTLTCKLSLNREYETHLNHTEFSLLSKYMVIHSSLTKTRYHIKFESRRGNNILDTEMHFNFTVDSIDKLGLILLEIELLSLKPFIEYEKVNLFEKLRPASQTILKPYIICPFTVSNKTLSIIVQNQSQ